MDTGLVAVKFLGIALVTLIVGIVLCFLASLGYNTYMKFTKKEIEVHSENSNYKKRR